MPTIAEVRDQYPQYHDISDSDLAAALHSKFYSDMPAAEFASKIGLTPPPDIGENRESTISALRGVPFLGAYVDKGTAALNAAAQPFTETGLSHADTFAGRRAENEQTIKAATDAYEASHPIGTTIGKMALGTAALAPAVALAPEAFGIGGTGGILGMMARGAATNAAIGGSDAALRGDNPGPSAALGGALGAAGPVVGAVARKLVAPIASNFSAMTDPAGYAARQVARGISESGLTHGEIVDRIMTAANDGTPWMLADAMGNPGQRLLSTVARAPGEGRTRVVEALENRQADQGRRVANAISEGFASPRTAAQTRTAMETARSADADAAYGAVRSGAGPVDVQSAIDHIDANVPTEPAAPDTISGRMQRYRRMLTNGDEDNPLNLSDFEQVQRVRSELSDEIQNARQGGQGNRARMLGQVLSRIDESLENSSSGFRQANRQFAQASRNIDAIDQGRAAATRGRSQDNIATYRGLTGQGQDAFRAGYADPLIEKASGDPVGTNKSRTLTSDAFRDEVAAIAPMRTQTQMQRRLANENTMFQTKNAALGNSKTVENAADDAAAGIDPSLIGHMLSGNWHGAARQLIQSSSNILNGNTAEVRARLADLLMQRGADVTRASLDNMVSQTLRRVQQIQRATGTTRGIAQTVATLAPEENQRRELRRVYITGKN